jgi:glutamine phosphoribosylpyrophosphate amidotransferase
MEDDDGLMIIGAKKTNEVKNYDKNDLQTCVNNFKKFAFCHNGELLNKETLSNLCLTGEIDNNYIRPLVWKTFLNVLSINNKIDDWVSQVVRQRQEFKGKLKNLNALKKFSGDPLGGANDVKQIKFTSYKPFIIYF